MAQRPVFMISNSTPYFREEMISFQYFNGFSESQRKKSIASLHQAFLAQHKNEKVLEISSKSENELGVKLSAFNLMITTSTGRKYSVESAFQASKVFEKGGPYKDLLEKTSREAKRDMRLKESGRLVSFHFSKKVFPLYPTTFFYNWLYINTLHLYSDLCEELLQYTAFTDIVFNPEKSLNCQARSAALYVSLHKQGILSKALESPESFLQVVYEANADAHLAPEQLQLSLWDM